VSIKHPKLQTKLDKCIEEKRFLDDVSTQLFVEVRSKCKISNIGYICTHILFVFFQINANLVKNQEMWRERIRKVQERYLLFLNYHKTMDELMLLFDTIPQLFLLDYS
jgi:hypothetical protein